MPAQNVARQRAQPQPVSPELDALLKQWEVASERIVRLEGEHQRRVYDMVFKVEKLSSGKFYHEVPDKGRIDIETVAVAKGAKSTREDKRTKQPFDLIGDAREKWICDGKRIVEIDEQNKEANVISIPPRGQGENIMNGPLPFLFGMKAEKAKARYQLSLMSDKVNPETRRRQIRIRAFPRWQSDGQNWDQADIILDHPTFLPLHVRLIDAAKTKETVFSFSKLKVNKRKSIFFPKDPFHPSLRGYKINTAVPGKNPAKPTINVGPDQQIVPDVSTYPIADAKKRLSQAGFQVAEKFTRGGPAPAAKLVHKIRTTVPAPMTPVKKGSVIKLVVFEKQK